MEEQSGKILSESKRIISKLQLLSVFFENEIVYKIYLRSQMVHRVFENSPELDIHQLELFHLQYTATVIDLLKKIKQTNERNVSLLYDEVLLNKELIEKIGSTIYTEKHFEEAVQRQVTKLGISLRKLYQVLSEDSDTYPFSNNITAFSRRYAPDFFQELPQQTLDAVTTINESGCYRNQYACIEKKLLGALCRHEFKFSFWNGFKTGGLSIEVYQVAGNGKYFLYYPAGQLFLYTGIEALGPVSEWSAVSGKTRMVRELQAKNLALENRAGMVKSALPENISNLLAEYADKISDVDFLKNISNFDVQANILKSMLNTDSI